ncbi:hypothetical protein N9V95_00465, partial [bacterium]|nr:hypothetical protein [bacterium]
VKIQPSVDRTILHLSGKVRSSHVAFEYTFTISQNGKGELKIDTSGHAVADFKANRVGLTVLHPAPECCGRKLIVRHGNGAKENTQFPLTIMPSQPVFDIAGLEHSLSSARVSLDFAAQKPDGTSDFFEMEDQRNWGDASYKTYVGSLRDPWPFQVKQGDKFIQSVTITASPIRKASEFVETNVTSPVASTAKFRSPDIAVSIPRNGAQLALANMKNFGFVKPSRFSAYLYSDALDERELLALAEICELSGRPLGVELEVCGVPESEIEAAAAKLQVFGIHPHSILAVPSEYAKSYQPDGEWPDVMSLERFYKLVRNAFPKSRVGGGMLAYFTELNRKWPPIDNIDFIAHAYCPIVHAADDETIIQNLATLPLIAASVAEKARDLPYEIVSSLLSMRQNPYGASSVDNPANLRMAMAAADPRETGQFGGLWMLEVARRSAQGHTSLLTVGAMSGPSSIYSADREDGRLPSYAAVEGLIGLQGADLTTFESTKRELIDKHFSLANPVFETAFNRIHNASQ